MITTTSLRHPMLRIRLDLAMKAAAWKSRAHGIGLDRVSGIHVVHNRSLVGGFRFYDNREHDITPTVLTALRGLTP